MRAHAFGPESGDLAPVSRRLFPDVPMPVHGEFLAMVFPRPDLLLAIEEGGLLKRWASDSGRSWRSLSVRELDEFAHSWRLNAQGTVAVGATGEDLSCWGTDEGELIWTVSSPDWVTAIAIDDANARFATGHDDGRVILWDLETGNFVKEIGKGDGAISTLSFDPAGETIAASDESCQICVWNLENESLPCSRLTGHKGRVVCLAWQPDTRLLLSAAWDTTVRLWNVNECRATMLINDHDGQVTAMAVAPGGQTVATVDSGASLRVWCLETWRCVLGPKPLPFEVKEIAHAPDGSLAIGLERSQVMVLGQGGAFGISLLDPANPVAVRPAVAVNLQGNLIALGPDGVTGCWFLGSPSCDSACFMVDGRPRRFLAMAFDGDFFVGLEQLDTGLPQAGLFQFQNNGLSAVRLSTLEGMEQASCCMAIDSQAGLVALASPLSPDLWIRFLPDGKPHLLMTDPIQGGSIQHLAFSPEGKKLAVAGIDAVGRAGQVLVIDPQSGREHHRIHMGGWRVAWHPDGELLALLDQEGRVTVTGVGGRIVGKALGGEFLRTIAFSADGAWLLAAGEDRVLRVWPPEGGVPVAAMELTGQAAAIHAMPDPNQVAVLFADGGVWVIDLSTLLEGQCPSD